MNMDHKTHCKIVGIVLTEVKSKKFKRDEDRGNWIHNRIEHYWNEEFERRIKMKDNFIAICITLAIVGICWIANDWLGIFNATR